MEFINFSKKEDVKKEDVLALINSIEFSSIVLKKIKQCVGGEDIGFHRWHQIYDVLVFYKEYKFPKRLFDVLLIRGQSDKHFQLIFISITKTWYSILYQVNLGVFEKEFKKELLKRKDVF